MVTVASRLFSSMAAGMPTMLERPTTTARLPLIGTLQRSSSSMQPSGVQGVNRGSRPWRCVGKCEKVWETVDGSNRVQLHAAQQRAGSLHGLEKCGEVIKSGLVNSLHAPHLHALITMHLRQSFRNMTHTHLHEHS